MALSRVLMLKSNVNNKYLCHSKAKLGFTYDHLNDSEQENKSIPHSLFKFEVEKSKSADDDLVHIRSCYNKKYLVRKSVESKSIAATGHEGEEDQSKWYCTLFKLVFLDSAEVEDADFPTHKAYNIRFLHVSESRQRCVGDQLEASDDDSAASSFSFTAIDLEDNVVLPEYVAFMGPNDKYLSSDGLHVSESFTFKETDVAAIGVAQRVTREKTQQITIIDNTSKEYWCLNQQDSEGYIDTTNNQSEAVLFEAVKVDENYTALKCKKNNMFVCSLPDQRLASTQNITQMAMLRVGEPVRWRTIINATFDLEDSRVYDNKSLEKFSDSRSNHTEVEQEGSFEVDYKTEKSSTWTNSTTVNIGIKTSWSSGIPYVGELGVEISFDHSQTWSSGEEIKDSKEVKYNQGIKISPGKKVMLKVLARKASCDVPYTYNVRDLMTDGTSREYTIDGLYTGSNEFLFDTQIYQEDL